MQCLQAAEALPLFGVSGSSRCLLTCLCRLQIALAMLLSFTHGAAVSRHLAGPFAAVCHIYYQDGGITQNVAPVNVLPHLVTAAFGLALGCVMYSYNMTATLGGSDVLLCFCWVQWCSKVLLLYTL